MTHEMRPEPVTRDDVLTLLSDDEVARVSTAGTALGLSDGEEYVDLERLDQGVRRAVQMTTLTGRLLPRRAVRENTWTKVVTVLGAAVQTAGGKGHPDLTSALRSDDEGQP